MASSAGLRINRDLRALAREKLKGNWVNAVLACFIFAIIANLIGWIPVVGVILGPIYYLIIMGPLTLGMAQFFMKLRRDEGPVIEDIFAGFKSFKSSFILTLLVSLFTFLWTLLFIVPGIIAGFRYAMAFYILYDNPDMKPMEAIRRSKEMMMGHKGQLFMLGLSFLGWAILGMLACFVGIFWVIPYIHASVANFYEDLKKAGTAPEEPLGTVVQEISSTDLPVSE